MIDYDSKQELILSIQRYRQMTLTLIGELENIINGDSSEDTKVVAREGLETLKKSQTRTETEIREHKKEYAKIKESHENNNATTS